MNGRLEKELHVQEKIDQKLNGYPSILRTYYTYLRASSKSYSTINVYINSIIKFLTYTFGTRIAENFYKMLTLDQVENFLIYSETTVKHDDVKRTASNTRCAYWSHLNSFFEFLVKRGYLEHNIMVGTNRPKNNDEHAIVYLTKDEVKNVINAARDARDKAILSVGFATGLRCSAVANINIADVDFENKTIKVIEKENKSREIAFSDQLDAALKEWLTVRTVKYGDADTDALFVSNKFNRISTDAINDMLKKYTKRCGIKKNITFHKCRSTLCVNALSAGVPIITVSKQLGHNSINTTQRYADAMNQDKQRLVSFMDSFI